MVRSLRMADMTGFVKAGDVQLSVTDMAQQKLAVQYLQQELYEANDPNLVDEEDMHIFGLRPMTDPLELVSCNACKKPIKTSHYAVHAVLCKTLNLSEEVALELRNGKVKKKPPRKERKKALPACPNRVASLAGKEVNKAPLAADIASVEQHVEVQTGTSSAETKRNGNFVMAEGSKARPDTDCSAGAVTLPAKRDKMITSEDLQVAKHQLHTENGVNKSCNGTNRKTVLHKGKGKKKQSTAGSGNIPNDVIIHGKPEQERGTGKMGKDKQKQSTAGSGNIPNDVIIHGKPEQERGTGKMGKDKQKQSTAGSETIPTNVSNYGKPEGECGMEKTDVPVPIATKVYYSQRNNRLQSSLTHLYHASSTDHFTELVRRDVMHRNYTPVASSAPLDSYAELISGHQDRMREQSSNSLQQSDQVLAQCPELLLRQACESPPAMHNQQILLEDDGLNPQNQVERERSNGNSSFGTNSGELAAA